MIKYCFKSYTKNLSYNIFIFIQLTITLFALFYTVCVFWSRYRFFSVIADDMKGKGRAFAVQVLDFDGSLLCDSKSVTDLYNLKGVSDVKATYSVMADVKAAARARYIAYDTPLIEAFVPDMYQGHWLNKEADASDHAIPVVVSYNDAGYECGDIFEITDGTNSCRLEIVGVLAENASVLFRSDHVESKEGYELFFWNYSTAYEEELLVLMDKKELDKTQMVCMLTGLLFINYDEDISGEDVENNLSAIYNHGHVYDSSDYATIYESSKRLIINDMGVFIPICCIVMLVTIVSTIKVITINTDNMVYNLSLYYLNGCTWKGCKKISIISNVLSLVMAVIVNVAALMLLFDRDIMIYDKKLLLYVGMVFMIFCSAYFIICVIYQTFVLKKYTPCDIIKGETR